MIKVSFRVRDLDRRIRLTACSIRKYVIKVPLPKGRP